ncbi:MAG: glycosyltransferase family 2 protein, partial [Chloroflexi bacterium]|nr:glycosyltransferase family 2 protein [Chloroflexota bacterium]
MVSILITAYREAATIGRAIEAFLPQLAPEDELLVVCPDEETTAVTHLYAAAHPQIRHVRDPQQGKPAALNVGLAAASGDLVVFSDGDVWVAPDALALLLVPFVDEGVGAVTGRPCSASPRTTQLG